ncbi:uncharacterized protein LOC135152653 [Daucus carota subsp. sativus]|uniref:uncharacterized protein LOC135152653 n=1 Tax=Daucus carota subsp. sativus TaxID=79200 RepID=UPI00308336CB
MAYTEPPEEPALLNLRNQNPNFVRSFSLKNQSNSSETISFVPPCFSTPSTPLSTHYSSNFQHELQPRKEKTAPTSVTYKCMSSILTKDGQILCIAVLNGNVAYTGSESNGIRIWKLPELTECGQIKSKAKMVVAIQVTNDRVFAAYADSKIRVWSRRTCRGVTKHVKLVTIPRSGGYVRSYISGKDKIVSVTV